MKISYDNKYTKIFIEKGGKGKGFIQNGDKASLLKHSGSGWSLLSLPLILTHVALLTGRFLLFCQMSAQSLEVLEVSKPNF